MNVKIFKNPEQVSIAASLIFAAQILQKSNSVLGLSTGSSPVKTYEKLIELYKKGIIDFSNVSTFNLDEYVGLSKDHPASYYKFMQENLFNYINIDKLNTHIPNGIAEDPTIEAQLYEKQIKESGGIDLLLLGIGVNAHIGFNEPNKSLKYESHLTDLSESTIEANKRFFDDKDQVPKKAISFGIGTILSAKNIILIATEENKAEAIYNTLNKDIDPMIPATFLRTHKNAIILLDEAAAHLL